ncbi:MAG: hypothetical protein AABZ34_10330 [Nitrospirota bacterium]
METYGSRLEVVLDMRAHGVKAYPDVFPMVLFAPSSREHIQSVLVSRQEEFLPVAGVAGMAMTTTVFCNESGEYIVYESDEHGFHNPRGIWDRRPAELLALGDSYTHGVCVPSDKGFVAIIRAQHPDTVNLGVNSHGPLTSLAALKESGPILKPKLVLWFYYEGNDLRDLDGWEKNSPLLMKYVASSFSQHLFERQPEIDRALRDYLDAAIAEAPAPTSFESIIKLQHLRRAVQSFYERHPAEQGLPAELLEHLRHRGAPAAAAASNYSSVFWPRPGQRPTRGRDVSCLSIYPHGSGIESPNWPAKTGIWCLVSPDVSTCTWWTCTPCLLPTLIRWRYFRFGGMPTTMRPGTGWSAKRC